MQNDTPTCSRCAHFSNAPAYLERALPGLSTLSSAWASVRSSDGLCRLHDCYLSSNAGCEQFRLQTGESK